MSTLAKFYASRGMSLANNGLPEKTNTVLSVALDSSKFAVLRRKSEEEKADAPAPKAKSDQKPDQKAESPQSYTSALDVLESVNSGLVDVFDRLQKAETMRDRLIQECEQQDEKIRQFQSELEEARLRYEAAEHQNSDIAERLISETSRASGLEHRAEQAEHALAEAQVRIDELEDVCKILHDGIYAVFGTGSPTQKALSTIAKA